MWQASCADTLPCLLTKSFCWSREPQYQLIHSLTVICHCGVIRRLSVNNYISSAVLWTVMFHRRGRLDELQRRQRARSQVSLWRCAKISNRRVNQVKSQVAAGYIKTLWMSQACALFNLDHHDDHSCFMTDLVVVI